MRLINTSTLRLKTFSTSKTTPPFAILSHTWVEAEDEISLEDMVRNSPSLEKEKRYGFGKIKTTCQLAREKYNLEYAYVDSCCII